MAGLCEGGNEPPGFLKASKGRRDINDFYYGFEQLCPPPTNVLSKQIAVVVITEDVQNIHLLLEYRLHIDVSLTCEHDPKLQEYCVCPQNMPQFDSEGIPNQAPEMNKPMILNGPISRNREGSDQVSVEAQAIGPPLPIHRSGNLRSKYRRAVRLKCAGAPSCKK
ncbi:hypothetical protein ANN_11631 [Periplaneta americana]|uniref:Uncharacterized protein n=1 Tax=Periplaneta americana TaxID=6978 RepID=A0ABQ8T6A4_PERAM|nr:hypothetical protein ANN_11631 [Periplaneta americana]